MTGEVLWQRQDLYPGEFSPDGKYLFAVPPGDRPQVILDAATGETVAEIQGSRPSDFPTMGQLQWEDEAHLVTTMTNNSALFLVRVSVDGTVSAPISDRFQPLASVVFETGP